MEFPLPRVERIDDYQLLTLPECGRINSSGEPALPVKTAVITMDPSWEVRDVEAVVKSEFLPGRWRIAPAAAPVPADQPRVPLLSKPSAEIYRSSAFFPAEWFEYRVARGLDPKTLTRVKYLSIRFYPLRYSPRDKRILRAVRAELRISYSRSDHAASRSGGRPGADSKTSALPYPKYALLIISSEDFEEDVLRLASLKERQGFSVTCVTTGEIYESSPGRDDPEKIRNYIIQYSESHPLEFLIIYGDADVVPVRYAYIPDNYYDEYEGIDGVLVETDLYYADLDGTWNADGDDRWGEIPDDMGDDDRFDGIPDVYAARIPVSDQSEARAVHEKLSSYTPEESWFTKYLLPAHDDSSYINDYIAENAVWKNFLCPKLYGEGAAEEAKAQIDEGCGFINFAGHGGPGAWCFTDTEFYNAASEQTNGSMAPVIFAMACSTSRFVDFDCIGEQFILNGEGGGIAYFGSSRVTWASYAPPPWQSSGLAPELDWRFSQLLFDYLDSETEEMPFPGAIWGRALADFVNANPLDIYWQGNGHLNWKVVAGYGTPFGDPSLPLTGALISCVDTIEPYRRNYLPLRITATVAKADIESVSLYYRYSPVAAGRMPASVESPSSWGPWTLYGEDHAPPWEGTFVPMHGDGLYEFFTTVENTNGETEPLPAEADAACVIDTAPPPAPELLSPADKAVLGAVPSFDWADVQDLSPVTYTIEIDDSSDFSSPELRWRLLGESHRPMAEVWAVGDEGVTLRWQGEGWLAHESPAAGMLESVAVVSPECVWAIGPESPIVKWAGAGWTDDEAPPPTEFLHSIHALSSDAAILVMWDEDEPFLAWDGWRWSGRETGFQCAPRAVFAVSPEEVWTVGWGGEILHGDGAGEWEFVASPTADTLNSLYMLSSRDGWAVGEGGTIIRWNGEAWSGVESPVGREVTLRSVHFISNQSGWAVGDGGGDQYLLQWDGSSWSVADVLGEEGARFNSVYMLSATKGWVAAGGQHTLYRWDGKGLHEVPAPASQEMRSISGKSLVLPAGRWFWRVKAIDAAGNPGDWSRTFSFYLVEKGSPEAEMHPTPGG